ncbi:MAG: hypothetical protein ACP5UI_01585 [Thermoprotei archaeon]|nr:hypothetical protein [TACK group archaeon]
MKVSTSFNLDPAVWKKLKHMAVEHDETISALVQRALESFAASPMGVKGLFLPEGAEKLAYDLKVLVTSDKGQVIQRLIESYLDRSLGDPQLLQRYQRGAIERWKHPTRTGKEAEAVDYLLKLAHEEGFPGFE